MWPRVVELMLGVWLVISPFVFRGTEDLERYTWSLVISGVLIVLASLFSYWHVTAQARFVTLLVSLWLAGHGYFAAVRPGPPAAQNEMTVGLLLMLFAIMPNDVNSPPHPWRRRESEVD